MFRLRTLLLATAAVTALVVPVGAAAPAQTTGSVRAALSLTAPASGMYGTTIALRGRLWRYGTGYGLASATVWLQRSPHGRNSWANIRNTRTGRTGTFAFSVTQSGAFDYRAYYAGSTTYTRAYSPTRYPVTTQKVVFDSITTTNYETGTLRASAWVYPLPPNGSVAYLQRFDPDVRVWHSIASGRTSNGKASITATRAPSTTAYRILVPARGSYGAGTSAGRSFAHYVWRGVFTRPFRYSGGQGGSEAMPDNNPRLDRGMLSPHVQRYAQFAMNATGCTRARVSASLPASHDTTVNISLSDGAQSTQGQVVPGSSGHLSMALANGNQAGLLAHNPSVNHYAQVSFSFFVLCRS